MKFKFVKFVRKLFEYFLGNGSGAEKIRYIIIGALTTLVNYGLFELFYTISGVDVTVSNVTSIAVAILFAYVANKQIVFRRHCDSPGELAQEFFKFIGTRLFSMALEVGGVFLFHNTLGYNARLCKLASLVLVIIFNYVTMKLIVFRGGDEESQ